MSFFGKTAAAQADGIHASHLIDISHLHERRHIVVDPGGGEIS